MVAAFAGLFRRGELYPRAMRFSIVVIALFFAVLCGWAVFSGGIQARSTFAISRPASRFWRC